MQHISGPDESYGVNQLSIHLPLFSRCTASEQLRMNGPVRSQKHGIGKYKRVFLQSAAIFRALALPASFYVSQLGSLKSKPRVHEGTRGETAVYYALRIITIKCNKESMSET